MCLRTWSELKPDYVKIDRPFVNRAGSERANSRIRPQLFPRVLQGPRRAADLWAMSRPAPNARNLWILGLVTLGLFLLVLSTMMLPAQVTMIPVFLIVKWFGAATVPSTWTVRWSSISRMSRRPSSTGRSDERKARAKTPSISMMSRRASAKRLSVPV